MISPWFWPRRLASGAPRLLRASDATACAALHATGFAHPWSAEEFAVFLTEPACSGDGIDAKSGLAGFILTRRALDEAEILTIVVDPRARRQDCGRRLLGAHLSRLSTLGVTTLFLEVDESNAAALALYRRHGFAQSGVRKGYYVKPDGMRANALMMRRALS